MTAALRLAEYKDESAPQKTAEGNVRLPAASKTKDSSGGIDWSVWVAVDDAARVLDRNVDALARDCRNKIKGRGQAMKAVGPDGGQARWWIHQDYNIKLHSGPIGIAQRVPDAFFEFTKAQQDQAMARATCVKRYRAILTDRKHGPRDTWIGGLIDALRADFSGLKISPRSLYRWHQIYRNERDLVKLIDQRGGNRKSEPDPAAWNFFCALFLTENKLSRKVCHRTTRDKAKAEGWQWCSYPQAVRAVRKKLPMVVRTKARHPDKYRSTMSPHMVMDPDAFAPGERWQGDHCVLDLFCRFQGRVIRPWLTAWFDTKSRRCVGWELCESPSSETIRSAFAQAMRDPANQGGPDIVHIDNGKDYKCEGFTGGKFTKPSVKLKRGYADTPEFHGLFGLLDIETIFAIPKNSRGKGHIESWFGYCIHETFDKFWDTYAGHTHDARPVGLTARLKDKATIPTFDQIHTAIATHIVNYNASTEHGKEDMLGQSPDQVMGSARRRAYADPHILEFLDLTYSPPCQVRRGAVAIKPLGKTLRYSSSTGEFIALSNSGRMVRVGYRQSDLFGTVYVFDAESMQLLATAEHERAGTSTFSEVGREDIKHAMAKQRKAARAAEVIRKDQTAAVQPTEILALREANRRRAAEAVGHKQEIEAQDTRLVQTILDGQSKKIQQANTKKAVGAGPAPVARHQIILDPVATNPASAAGRINLSKPVAARKPKRVVIDDITKLRPTGLRKGGTR